MGRIILAIIVGVISGGIFVGLFEYIGHQLFPTDLQPGSTPEEIKTYLETAPIGALVSVVVAWFLGSLGGAIIGRLLDKSRSIVTVILICLLLMSMTILNFLVIPHPLWMMISGIAVYFLSATIVLMLFKSKHVTKA